MVVAALIMSTGALSVAMTGGRVPVFEIVVSILSSPPLVHSKQSQAHYLPKCTPSFKLPHPISL